MLAELYLQNNKADKALEICHKIFELEPNEPQTHLMLSQYYKSISDENQSFSHLKIAFQTLTSILMIK